MSEAIFPVTLLLCALIMFIKRKISTDVFFQSCGRDINVDINADTQILRRYCR